MVTKHLKSKKGSTLVLVLVTLSILSILGIAIIGLSVINYKMKIVDKNVKTSFYLAEAGLEEAYAVIGKTIDDGIKAGNSYSEDQINSFITEQRRIEARDPENDESNYINGSDGFGSVNERFLKRKIEEWFRQGYARCLNDGFNDGENDFKSLEYRIANTAYSVVESSIDEKKPTIRMVGSPAKFPSNPDELDQNDKYVITLESEFPHENITKIIRGTFDIKIPTYDSPFYVKNVMVKLKENVLWSKPITTEKNIYVLGDDVTINGYIYAYGDDENNIKGGIVVGNNGKSGTLKVNGNMATNEFIYTNEDNSQIDAKGDINCNSIAIPDNTTGCIINIDDGTVNTYDDIELNGKKAQMKIDGPYYGFSDGSSNTVVHDQSSSIVINSEDIGKTDGSKLIITGEEVDSNNILNKAIGNDGYNELYPKSGVFIGGTVYISLDNSAKYQTGESVSIKGNYKSYGELLDDVDERDDKFDPDNIVMGSYPPLVLISKYKEEDTYKEYNVIDKSKYINYYESDYPDKLNLGESNGIEINNLRYSAGAYVSQNSINDNIAVGGLDLWVGYSRAKLDDYRYFVNKMSDFLKISDPYTMPNKDDRIYIGDRFSFATDINPSIEDNELVCVNNDSSKAIFVKGKNGTEISDLPADIRPSSYKSISLSESDINGIIVTKGDVIITGDIDYTGIIVAEGNVYLYDDKPKVIENEYGGKIDDRACILNIMSKNDILREQFINGVERSFLVEVEAGESDIKSYLKFEDLVDIKWEKIK